MIIYPAIDLRGGKVVRLKEGKREQQTIFSDNPLEIAQQWQDQGAEWLHIVNLDGAFAEANNNGDILQQIAQLGVKVQFGGGLRTLADIEQAFTRGVQRVVLGTIAIQQPEHIPAWIAQFGADRLCIALDAKDGTITTHGWQEATDLSPLTFGARLYADGIRHALYTDVSRDGSLSGVNIADTVALGRTGLGVIASGGVSSVQEISELAQSGSVAGAVIGMALYEGKIILADALDAANN